MDGLRPWVMAARPATLWAAATPVFVGGALAAKDGVFRWDVLAVTLAAATLIQVGVNYANDLSDAVRGADTERRVGPQRAVSSGLIGPEAMKRGIGAVFGLAALLGLYLVIVAGWVVLVIGLMSILAALGYTGGPVPYGYRGLGELFVFVFFGLVATVGSRYVHDGTAPLDAWVGGVVMGLLATAILVANNLRDIETDAGAGKRTLAVRLGRPATRTLFASLVWSAYAVVAGAAIAGWIPPWSALALLAAPLAVPIVRTVSHEQRGPALIGALKGTARLQAVTGALFAVGALIGV